MTPSLDELKRNLRRTFSVLLHGGYDVRELTDVLDTLKDVDKLVESYELLQQRHDEARRVIELIYANFKKITKCEENKCEGCFQDAKIAAEYSREFLSKDGADDEK